MHNKKPKILVCPLNWGLGHATRVVPIIEQLKRESFDIWIASSGDSQIFLKQQFPNLNYIDFPNYKVKYSASESQVLRFICAVPKIILGTIIEHVQQKKIIKKHNFDIVISDNRYGLWNRSAHTIFITHQLNIKLPGKLNVFEPLLKHFTKRLLKKYNECWIPDVLGEESIAGELSQPCSLNNLYYIGLLSRYRSNKELKPVEKEIDLLFILSGPEPQRTIFEDIIWDQTKNSKLSISLVRGTSIKRKREYSFPVYDLLNSEELLTLIFKSEVVICRSGYSSVMDLIAMNKKAFFVPTPGQTEQEYLAEYLQRKGLFNSVSQNEFNIEMVMQNNFNVGSNKKYFKNDLLKERILLLKEEQNNK
jgi:uncharacterized protein (TIGR00661 family)